MDLTYDIIALGIFVICILIYSIMIIYGLRHPTTSRKGSLNLIYEYYVDERVKESPLIAVQAIRNIIMANTAFISSLLVLLGLLLAFYQLIFSVEMIPGSDISLGFIQMVVMVIIIVFCLFNFVLAIRMLVRFTLLISANPEKIEFCGMTGLQFTKDTMISAQNHWSFGLRGLFYLITVLAWLAHPILFLIGAIGVTTYLIFFEDIYDSHLTENTCEDENLHAE
ncbi:hypothetical protein CEE45_12135 [Candidatus Heimdallarchaeota archaeon B3_Heim]|nr:MAG: hypothetical protein CEE45_12135 [Candidatus Heimdallarchaeota archaeon B3_Heim]